ncbi:MAG: hypothetical protein LBC90_04850, partial [Candidatus Adiutrix sp.]|nr:hypothetical protein [Candidatus Adiutrix sp.]
MKLSTKIFFGFILTNVIYVLLLVVVFVVVRPVETDSEKLVKYVMSAYENSTHIRYLVAEQRSTMRAYLISPTKDRKIFDQFIAVTKAADEDISLLSRLLSDPEAALIQTPAITAAYRNIARAVKDYTVLAMATPDRLDKVMASRRDAIVAYEEEVLKALDETMKMEKEALLNELRGEAGQAVILHRYEQAEQLNSFLASINASALAFARGLLGNNQALMDRSLALSADAVRQISAIIADSSVKAVRESLEKVRLAITEKYEPNLKTSIALMKEDDEITAKRAVLTEEAVREAGTMGKAVQELSHKFTAEIAAAVGRVNAVMLAGAALALAVSLILAAFLTRSIILPVNRIIETLTESAQEVDGASTQLTTASNTLAEGATENAASLEETSAALEELSSMTKRNADNAAEANSLMAQASDSVHQAESSMTKVIGAMEEIARSGNEIGK